MISFVSPSRCHTHLCSLIGTVALALSGCGSDVDDSKSQVPSDEVGVNSDAVSGGSSVTRVGVVAFVRQRSGWNDECSGVLLNRYSILTAAHCFPDMQGGQTQRVTASVVYKQPSGTLVCLTRGGVNTPAGSNPQCVTGGSYDVSTYPGWVATSTDAAHDLAVMRSVDIFAGVTPADYALIDADAGLSEDGRLEFYGYGPSAQNGTGSGVLRVGAGEIDAVNPQHVNLVGGGARSCEGDSGGPASIYFSQTSPYLLVEGVASSAQFANKTDQCAESGGLERYSRVGTKMDFITSKIGFNCPTVYYSKAGRNVRRCYAPPQAFWSRANAKWVQASNAGNGPLIAAATQVGQWETFEVLTNSDGSTSLVAFNDKLVTAENAGASSLIPRAIQIGDWEKFWNAPLSIDGFSGSSLRAQINGRYVAAEDAGASPLIARTSGAPSYWEQFFFEFIGDPTGAP